MALKGLSTVVGNGERIVSSLFKTRYDPQSTAIIFSTAGIDVIGLTESNGKTRIDNFFQLDTNGETPFGAEAARKLSRALTENGMKRRKVCNIVGENEYSLRYVDLPEMPIEEVIDSLRFSERESFPFPLENAVIDASILNGGSQSGRLKILMAALDAVSVDKYRAFFKDTNLKHSAISTIPSALTALISKSKTLDSTKGVTFLTFDNSVTGLYIFRNGEPEFIRQIPFGMRHLAYSQVGNLSKRSDELINETVDNHNGTPPHKYKNADQSDFWGYVQENGPAESNFERLVFELKRSLEYYNNEFGTAEIEKLLSVAASPRIETDSVTTLSSLLSKSLSIAVEPYNPFDDFLTVEKKSLSDLHKLGNSLAIPVGIAIDRGKGLNLLPLRDRYSLMRKSMSRLPLIALTAYLIFVSLFAAIDISHNSALNRQIESKERQIADKNINTTTSTAEIESEIAEYRKRISVIDSRLKKYPPLLGKDISWVKMFHDLSSKIPADIALDSVEIKFNTNGFRNHEGNLRGNLFAMEGSVKGTTSQQLLTLRGFINELKKSDHFKKPSLASSNRIAGSAKGPRILNFRVTSTDKGS